MIEYMCLNVTHVRKPFDVDAIGGTDTACLSRVLCAQAHGNFDVPFDAVLRNDWDMEVWK
jgi:hypothetical protein